MAERYNRTARSSSAPSSAQTETVFHISENIRDTVPENLTGDDFKWRVWISRFDPFLANIGTGQPADLNQKQGFTGIAATSAIFKPRSIVLFDVT